MKEEFRPRLSPDEYQIIKDYRNGVKPVVKQSKKSVKILLFDIETIGIQAMTWGLWKQNVNTEFIFSDWFILSWAAKWLDEDAVYSSVLTPKEVADHDDFRIVTELWDMLDEADVIIAHNLEKFDKKKVNTRFLFHQLPPPSHYDTFDTLKQLRENFAITSNRLDYVNKWLGLEGKIKTEASLWMRCIKGEQEALTEMETYNKEDVMALERNYLRIRGWSKDHPNVNLFDDSGIVKCPNCGSENLEWNGYKTTKVSRYKAYTCSDCGHIGHSRYSDMTKEERKLIVR